MEKNNMDSKGIIPDVLSDLLGARSATKRMKNESNEFKKKFLMVCNWHIKLLLIQFMVN